MQYLCTCETPILPHMKKVPTLLILLLLGPLAAHAQEPRTWSMGPLTWNDFTPVAPLSAPNGTEAVEHSFIEFVFDIKTVTKERNGIQTGEPEAVAYTVKSKSWVDSLCRTPAELRYNQVLWDMVELYRRQLQQWINADPEFNDEALLDSIMQMSIIRTDRYCEDTRFGQDTDAVRDWEKRTRSALLRSDSLSRADSAAVRASYTYTDDQVRLGASLCGSFIGTGGELHDYFSHGGGLSLGFELGYQRHFLIVNGSIGGAKCLKNAPNVEDPINDLYIDDPLQILNGFFAYGISVIDRTKFRLTPFVGWGGIGYFFTEDDDSSDDVNSFGSGNGCWHFGVDMQYHFHNSIFGMEHDRYSVNLKLFGTYNRFRAIQGVPEGFTFNVQLGVSFLTGFVDRVRIATD